MKKLILILSFLVLAGNTVYAGTTLQNLSKTVQYVQMDKIEEQRKEAKEASQKALSREDIEKLKKQAKEVLASSSIKSLQSLISLRNAVAEQKAFNAEIILHLSLNKKYGNFLTEFDVIQLKRYAEDGRYKEAVKYMDGIIEARSSSPVGASVFCGSQVLP